MHNLKVFLFVCLFFFTPYPYVTPLKLRPPIFTVTHLPLLIFPYHSHHTVDRDNKIKEVGNGCWDGVSLT